MTHNYTVRLLYDVHGWAYFNRTLGIAKYAPPDFKVTRGGRYGQAFKDEKHDAVLQLCYDCAKKIRQHVDKAGYGMAVVTGINVGWEAGKGYLKTALESSDAVLFNSRLAYSAFVNSPSFEECGYSQRQSVSHISNGVDLDIFKPTTPIEKRESKVLWCSSVFHNKQKGYEDILKPLKERLAKKNISCELYRVDSHAGRKLKNQQQMAEWYNTGTIYVCASKTEGTPNPALEAAGSGCVVVSTPVGNMPELIEDGKNGYLVDRNVDAIELAVLQCVDNYQVMAENMQGTIQSWHWKVRAQEYYTLFRRLIDERRKRDESYR